VRLRTTDYFFETPTQVILEQARVQRFKKAPSSQNRDGPAYTARFAHPFATTLVTQHNCLFSA